MTVVGGMTMPGPRWSDEATLLPVNDGFVTADRLDMVVVTHCTPMQTTVG